MQTLALPNYSALGSIVTAEDNYWSAEKAVYAAGWKYLGGGATAHVYRSPSGDRAIKLVRGDDGNRATLDASLAFPDNPHLPKVYGFLTLACDHFAVEMEVLEPQSGEHRAWSDTWSPGRGDDLDETLPDYILNQPDCPMKEALEALHAAALEYPEMMWDCHSGNIMVRPATGEIVLNDLLYGQSSEESSSGLPICDRCCEEYHEAEGICVGDEFWCGLCAADHAFFCEHAQEYLEGDKDDPNEAVPFLHANDWPGRDWWPCQFFVHADNKDAFTVAGGGVEDGGRLVEPRLHAVLTAIQGIAQEALALTVEPRLPFPLAA